MKISVTNVHATLCAGPSMSDMKKITAVIFALAVILGCKNDTTEVREDDTPRLVLTADKTSGQAPLAVNFTGNFLGRIDTIQMLVPDNFFFPGTGRTLIPYALPDTTQPAKRTYTAEYTYNAGVYKAVMLLQSKNRNNYSDTLVITVN